MKVLRDYLFFIVMGVVFEILLFTALKYHRDYEIRHIEQLSVARINTQINSVLNYYHATSELLITQILSDTSNIQLLRQMDCLDEVVKNKARDKLYDRLKNNYFLFTKYDFRQLHFHDKQGNSFLRFHQKDYFGDNLLKIRPTIAQVHLTKKPTIGFEEGKIVNGFRNVFPIFDNNEFLGSVELSNSFEGIMNHLHKNYPFEYKLIISKKDVDSKLFPELIQKHYQTSSLSNEFYEEKINKSTLNKNISEKTIAAINDHIHQKRLLKVDLKPQIIGVNILQQSYIVAVLPIINFDKSITTYAISYSQNDALQAQYVEFYLGLILANLLMIVIAISFLLRKYLQRSNEYATKAYFDPLTGCYNRQRFDLDIKSLFSDPLVQAKINIVFFDIDFFKSVNDTFGHDVGDLVLTHFMQVAKSQLRGSDFIYRWGGEEFILIVLHEDIQVAIDLAEKIRHAIQIADFSPAQNITGSFGVVHYKPSDTVSSLVKRADLALYQAKQTGRNRVCLN